MPRAADYGALLDALRGVRWPARRRAAAGPAGTHRSVLRGLAAEFTEYRPYRQGDDPHRLDWKLLARTDRAYFRLSDDHVALATLLIVDASASMAFPPTGTSKWDAACLLAAGVAAVAHAAGDPVGLRVTGSPAGAAARPRGRRGTVHEIIRTMGSATPGGTDSPALLLAAARGAGRLVVISDLLGDAEALRTAVAERIVAGTEVHVLHVVAPEELEPAGNFLAVDPEQPEVRRPLLDETRLAYRERFDAWRREVQGGLRRAGARVTEVRTDEPAARAVRRIVRSPT